MMLRDSRPSFIPSRPSAGSKHYAATCFAGLFDAEEGISIEILAHWYEDVFIIQALDRHDNTTIYR